MVVCWLYFVVAGLLGRHWRGILLLVSLWVALVTSLQFGKKIFTVDAVVDAVGLKSRYPFLDFHHW